MATIDAAPRARSMPTRADFRRLLGLALPIAVVQVGMMAMGLLATIMLGHFSAVDLAASALGTLYGTWIALLAWGVLLVLDPVVAQAVGARDPVAAALGMQRGLVLALVVSLATSLLCLPARAVFAALGQPAEIVRPAASYVLLSIPGVLPFFVFIVLRQGLQAMGRTRAIVITILAANVVHGILCWALVFGHLGSPRLGVSGAALAITVTRGLMPFGLLALGWSALRPTLRPLRMRALDPRALAGMLRLGLPIGIQQQLEYGIFAVVGVFIGRLGTVPMAAHQVALMMASAAYMIPQGIGAAAAVLVGQDVGAGDRSRARRSAAAALVLGAGFMLLSGLAFVGVPGPLARFFSTDAPVLAVATLLLPIAGVFQLFDGIQVVSIGVLRGVADTRAPMVVSLLGYWIVGVPLSVWFGLALGAGAAGLWWGLVVGLVTVAAILLARVRSKLGGALVRLELDEAKAATDA